jgi:SAM-dependent methyltransferase
MTSDYAELLSIRSSLYPNFNHDQTATAEMLFAQIEDMLKAGSITSIVDLGCGTGEIIDRLRHLITTRVCDRRVRCIGIDCCKAEIDLAQRRRNCEFRCEDAEDIALLVDLVDWSRTLLLCVGHTLPHFQNAKRFFDGIKELSPAFMLVDFHHEWDDVVERLTEDPTREERDPKRIGEDGKVYVLTTRCSSETGKAPLLLRGIEVWQDRDIKSEFWTEQIPQTSKWFLRELEALGYIPERELRYEAGYGPMRAHLLSRPDARAMTINDVYYRTVSQCVSRIFASPSIQQAMGLFAARVVSVILPFDGRHIFARYASIVEGAEAPHDLMYVAKPDNVQTRLPTAFGLYMCLLNTVSSSTVIPLSDLNIPNVCKVDKDFGDGREAKFFNDSNPGKEAIAPETEKVQAAGDGDRIRSFFVVPFFYADLPLFCLVVNFRDSLPVSTTDHSVYSSILSSVSRLVRQELLSHLERYDGKGLFVTFVDAAVTSLAKSESGYIPSAKAIEYLDLRMSDARNREWKSWLLTLPSHRIRNLALVREEAKTLGRVWDKAKRHARSDIFVRISDWFRAGDFFLRAPENTGQSMFCDSVTTAADTKDPHETYVETTHRLRLETMRKIVGVPNFSTLIESAFLVPSMKQSGSANGWPLS